MQTVANGVDDVGSCHCALLHFLTACPYNDNTLEKVHECIPTHTHTHTYILCLHAQYIWQINLNLPSLAAAVL